MSLCLRTLRIVIPLCAAVAFSGLAVAQQPQPAQNPPPAAKPPAPAPAPAVKTPPAQLSAPATKDPVVATVNGQPIHLSELEIAQQALPPQYRTMPLASVFPALLDRIADSKLVVGDAKKNKIETDSTFKRRMAFVEDQVIQDYWLQREIAKRITPDKLQQRYQEKLKSMPPEEEVHARHILVATEAEAKDLLAELKKGTPIEKLAKDKSTDKASGAEGGDLGWFKRTDMVKEFSDAAFALKKGELSETPIKTQFGYHIIQPLADAKPATSFEDVKATVKASLLQEKRTQEMTKWVEDLRDQYKNKVSYATGYAPPELPEPTETATQ